MIKKVCVITGGGSGMGLATAKILGKENYIIIVGRTIKKLEAALKELEDEVDKLVKYCAIKRLGHVEEIANLMAFCASDKAGYLTGVDILCDGGCVASGCNPFKKSKN